MLACNRFLFSLWQMWVLASSLNVTIVLRHFPVDKINSAILLNEETSLKTKQREKCKETFKDTLKRHSKICTGAKSENQFKVFHKIFLQESNLKLQLPTHNRKKYSCTHCGRLSSRWDHFDECQNKCENQDWELKSQLNSVLNGSLMIPCYA